MDTTDYVERPPREFLGAIGRAQSYLNIVYLLLSFPLGWFYLVFLITGLAAGIGLLVVWLGIPILALVLAAAAALARGERQLANSLLDARIPASAPRNTRMKHPWRTLKTLVRDGRTWSGLLFLFLKFPLGVASFVLTVALAAVTIALLLVPIAMRQVPVHIGDRLIQTGDAALLCVAAGLLLGVLSIYALNGVAAGWRALARRLLAPPSAPSAQAAVNTRTGPIIIP